MQLVVRREGSFARAYAMKRLLPHLASDPEVRAMFVEEARIAGLIRHANAVSVLDVGEDRDGPFLVMDFVEGVPLSEILRRARASEVGLPVQVCVDIARQTAEGLRAAHELTGAGGRRLDVIHRDVSPANVLLGFDGVARVTDFGVARALDRSSRTRAGVLKGKLGYMSPEQLRFEAIDARSDLFSLGVVLFELLAGRGLYVGERDEIRERILKEPPPDIGEQREDVPPDLVALLFELMAKDPASRPADARSVAARLTSILAEVRAEEGPLDVAEWVQALFAEERARQRQMIAVAIEDRDTTAHNAGAPARPTPAEPPKAPLASAKHPERAEHSEAPTRILSRPPESAPGSKRRMLGVAALSIAVLLLGGGALLLAWAQQDREGLVEPASTASPVRPGPSPDHVAPVPDPVVPTEDDLVDDSTPTEEPETEPSDTALEPVQPSMRTRRERAVMQSTMTTGKVPAWDWE